MAKKFNVFLDVTIKVNTSYEVNAKDAEAIGTGKPVKLIDASLDRPPDRAFYRVGVSIPIQ